MESIEFFSLIMLFRCGVRILHTTCWRRMSLLVFLVRLKSRDGHMPVLSSWLRGSFMVIAVFHFQFSWIDFCLTEMVLLTAEGAENGLEFTIVRPFNWIGPRMDFIPGIDGPSEGVPRVLACFSNVSLWDLGLCLTLNVAAQYFLNFCSEYFLQNLLRGEPLKLVDGGQSQRTFVYIKDAIEAVLLMIVGSHIQSLTRLFDFKCRLSISLQKFNFKLLLTMTC